ncbi:hypothetical protein EDD28_0374 [Salana multivorans]|uniref:Barstar (barnase inhibitor) domain-containing protein n=1 Tax=Salana multivorans TaxID=120377 RepID=A0A3N2D7Z4_9MICO|nr:ribonuclease inhibitor [Salana multivorans]ROR95812.1 hypothetical protein EDD28_0374 [Salana multivorans]
MAEESRNGSAHVFRIEGARIDTIEDLYAQLNTLLMQEEDWELGASLDALNDVLYRFNPKNVVGPTVFVWADHGHSREALGRAATARWLEEKLRHPDSFDVQTIRAQRDALMSGEGKTYFEIVLEVFAEHAPDVRLELD